MSGEQKEGTRKQQFIADYKRVSEYNWETEELECELDYIVVAVRLPSSAVELITNTFLIHEKFEYYCIAYDDKMRLRANPDVKIINWMFV